MECFFLDQDQKAFDECMAFFGTMDEVPAEEPEAIWSDLRVSEEGGEKEPLQ